MAEYFDVVNVNDKIIGKAERKEVHGNPKLIHRVAHVIVFNSKGELFLQKRSRDKTVQPGKWDTSVGGHVDSGEDYLAAAVRETSEELGIEAPPESFKYLYKYLHRNVFESEYVSTYRLVWDGKITIQQSEIEDGRFWSIDEISKTAAADSENPVFTPNFLDELKRFTKVLRL